MFSLLDRGSFISDGNARDIPLPGSADLFVLTNRTEQAAANTKGFEWTWYPELANGEAVERGKAGTNAVLEDLITANGLTYRTSRPEPEAEKTGTTLTAASPAVGTSTAHGYANSDRVRIYNSTAMLQIGGMEFSVSGVTANTFDLAGLDASGFAAGASAFKVRRLPPISEVLPRFEYVTKVSKAASCVVTFSAIHSYVIGQVLEFKIPSAFGMVELDGVEAKVTAIGTYTVTLELDSTAFTTFAFPVSASVPVSFALSAPAGQNAFLDTSVSPNVDRGYNLDASFRSGQVYPYMHLGSAVVGSNAQNYVWYAWKAER